MRRNQSASGAGRRDRGGGLTRASSNLSVASSMASSMSSASSASGVGNSLASSIARERRRRQRRREADSDDDATMSTVSSVSASSRASDDTVQDDNDEEEDDDASVATSTPSKSGRKSKKKSGKTLRPTDSLTPSTTVRFRPDDQWQPPPFYVPDFHIAASIKKTVYKRLGDTHILISRFSLGGATFGGLYGECENVTTIVREALRNGVTYLDTGYWYGQVKSEELIGQALKGIPRRAYYIGTKVGRYELDYARVYDLRSKSVLESIEESCWRLGVKHIDLCQVQVSTFTIGQLKYATSRNFDLAPSEALIIEETLPAVHMARMTGRVKCIALTGYPLAKVAYILDRSTVKIDAVVCYARGTLADGSLGEYMAYFQSKGVAVINAAPTGMGLLTPQGPPAWHPAPVDVRDACEEAVGALYRVRECPRGGASTPAPWRQCSSDMLALLPGNRHLAHLCSSRPPVAVAAYQGLKEAVMQCGSAMAYERWTCPVHEYGTLLHRPPILRYGYKETAYLTSLSSAGAAWAVATGCVLGRLPSCACDVRSHGTGSLSASASQVGWQWAGCSYGVKYGLVTARKLLRDALPPNPLRDMSPRRRRNRMQADRRAGGRFYPYRRRRPRMQPSYNHYDNEIDENDALTLAAIARARAALINMHKHNFKAGRQHKYHDARLVHLAPFVLPAPTQIGARNSSSAVRILRSAKRQIDSGAKWKVPARELVYLEHSPNFCRPLPELRHAGVHGRLCNVRNETHSSGDCDRLCCGRGYTQIQQRYTERCNCKFVWCCRVECDQCVKSRLVSHCT